MAKEPKMLSAEKVAKELRKSEREARSSMIEDLASEIGTWDVGETLKTIDIAPEKQALAAMILKEGGWKFTLPTQTEPVFIVNRPEVPTKKAAKPAKQAGTRRAGRDPSAE